MNRVLNTCRKCGWLWFSQKGNQTSKCPHCLTTLWLRDRKTRITTGVQGGNAIKVIGIRESNPCATLQQVGDEVGITKERVRQILVSSSLPTRHYTVPKLFSCLNCGKPTYNKKYCRKQCWYEYTHPLLTCDTCGTLFRRGQSQIISRANRPVYKGGIFCSRKCIGKYEYNQVSNQVTKLRQQGFIYNDIAKALNIPLGSLSFIVKKTNTRMPRRERQSLKSLKSPRYAKQHIRARWLKHLNFTDSAIIEMIHCSASTISRALHTESHVALVVKEEKE